MINPTSVHSQAVLEALPHRPPMLLVDEIVSWTEERIVCKKTFAETEFFVQGHFPGYPIVPGVILCECCLQSGAILLRKSASKTDSPDTKILPIATRLDNVKFKRMVRPGDTIRIEVTLNEVVSTAYFMTGKIMLDESLAARLDFACSVTAIES